MNMVFLKKIEGVGGGSTVKPSCYKKKRTEGLGGGGVQFFYGKESIECVQKWAGESPFLSGMGVEGYVLEKAGHLC